MNGSQEKLAFVLSLCQVFNEHKLEPVWSQALEAGTRKGT
jgi:hypothetical protein